MALCRPVARIAEKPAPIMARFRDKIVSGTPTEPHYPARAKQSVILRRYFRSVMTLIATRADLRGGRA